MDLEIGFKNCNFLNNIKFSHFRNQICPIYIINNINCTY